MHSRIPVRPDDSSRNSEMPVIFPVLTNSAIRSDKLSGLTWYGSSVTTNWVRPRESSSTSTAARMVIEPRPVRYASSIPRRPTMYAAVGKSGPFTRSINASKSSSRVAVGFSNAQKTPSATSRKLCGGMFVAIPTAIPAEPLTNRFGKRAGRTSGS